MTMRAVLDKLQTTPIAQAFHPYVHHPDTISPYVQGLLEQQAPLDHTDFSALRKIHQIESLSDELKDRIFHLCIKSGIIDPREEEEGGSDDFYSSSPVQQHFILSTIELIPIDDRTEKTLDAIAVLFQDITDHYDKMLQEIQSIPENLRASIIRITTSPFSEEESGIEKAFKLKFFLLLPEDELSSDNWLDVEMFVEGIFESIDEDDAEEELISIALEEIYEEIKGYPREERADIIRSKLHT
ncbi:MAG: hypothetical protein NTX49_00720 [Chlamydiae bacterium]|nr:hypothetical protein [Chlamydiota bacterium]